MAEYVGCLPSFHLQIFTMTDIRSVPPEELRMLGNHGYALALEAMSGCNREIILLRDVERLNYPEISQILGIASGTVMSRLHRARQQLRRDVMSGQKPETS